MPGKPTVGMRPVSERKPLLFLAFHPLAKRARFLSGKRKRCVYFNFLIRLNSYLQPPGLLLFFIKSLWRNLAF
jgi:hypothetical protein